MILNSRSNHKGKILKSSKDSKRSNNKTSSTITAGTGGKVINKYGSTQALLKDPSDFSKQSFTGHGRTSPFFNQTLKSAREDARFLVPVTSEQIIQHNKSKG